MQADTVFLAVGRAMSAWELLEVSLASVYASFLRMRPSIAIKRPEYIAATSFAHRASLIEGAAETYFKSKLNYTLECRFADLINAARGFSKRRNDIAHGIVVHNYRPDKIAAAWVLCPSTYTDKRFTSGRPDFLYGAIEIDVFRERVRRLDRDVCMFAIHLDPLPPESLLENI